jgi:hypothetical protein
MTTDDRATIDYLLSDDAHPPSPLSLTEKEAVRRLVEERRMLLAACKAAILKFNHPVDKISIAADMLRDAITEATKGGVDTPGPVLSEAAAILRLANPGGDA